MYIVYGLDSKGRENVWYSDVMWCFEFFLGFILCVVEVFDVGGDILFCDMYVVFDGLFEDMKEKVCGLIVVYDYMKNFGCLYL